MSFKFIVDGKIEFERDATPYYPRTGNLVWFNNIRHQVTAIHVDYSKNEMRFYCSNLNE